MQSPPTIIGPRLVERFQCRGADCEDTCCHGAEVIVSADRLRKVLAAAGTPAERDRVYTALTVRDGWESDPSHYGRLKPGPDGNCVFLDGARRCELKARSEELLWDACADYPARAARTGNRLEISATLGCPEIARLALLAADGTDLVALDAARVPRGVPDPTLPAEPTRAYDRYLDDIRGAVLQVLSAPGLPVPLRLFILSVFAERTAGFFHQDALLVDEPRLADELLLVRRPEVHENCRAAFDALAPDPQAVMRRLAPLLVEVIGSGNAGLADLVGAVLRGAGGDAVPLLVARYEARVAAWAVAHATRLDRAITNFAQVFWLHDWFTRSRDLRAHGQKLVVRIALLRLLVLCHPRLDGLDPWSEAAGAAFDAATVDAATRLSRALDRDAAWRERVEQVFAGAEGERLERLALRA